MPSLRLTSSSSRHALAFALTCGMYFFLAATGLHARWLFSHAPSDQALFLAHLLAGYLSVPLIVTYTWKHVAIVRRSTPLAGELISYLSGAALTASTVAALASGIDLSLRGASSSRVAVVQLHYVSVWVTMCLLPSHVLWALYRRVRTGRSSSIPIEDRLITPSVLLAFAILFVATVALYLPAATPAIPVPQRYTYIKGGIGPFFPGQARTTTGQLIPVDHLSQSERCGACHVQIHEEWNSSTHRFAASNDHYVAQVKLRIHDVPVKPHLGARFCANCHEPIALFAGEIDLAGGESTSLRTGERASRVWRATASSRSTPRQQATPTSS